MMRKEPKVTLLLSLTSRMILILLKSLQILLKVKNYKFDFHFEIFAQIRDQSFALIINNL